MPCHPDCHTQSDPSDGDTFPLDLAGLSQLLDHGRRLEGNAKLIKTK
jgi:hypothetical protein